MNFNEFVQKNDKPNSIVLLEGKRSVLENDIMKLENLGKQLAKATKHITFRSGNALGADYYFCKGVAEVDINRIELITPYKNHKSKLGKSVKIVSLDDIDLSKNNIIIEYSLLNKKTKDLVEKYAKGINNNLTIKATYIIRDTVKVLGTESLPKASFAIFYDDLLNPFQGGTGHTMNICKLNNVEFINQSVWFDWLE
jgi:hypothetical protein